jgi:hypothetical protein
MMTTVVVKEKKHPSKHRQKWGTPSVSIGQKALRVIADVRWFLLLPIDGIYFVLTRLRIMPEKPCPG